MDTLVEAEVGTACSSSMGVLRDCHCLREISVDLGVFLCYRH